MKSFAEVQEIKLYLIEGEQGFFRKITYREARRNPDAVRGAKGNSIFWFLQYEVKENEEG